MKKLRKIVKIKSMSDIEKERFVDDRHLKYEAQNILHGEYQN